MKAKQNFKSFQEFYRFYLEEHKKTWTKIFHVTGTFLFLALVTFIIIANKLWLIPVAIVTPYFFAWISHFFIEKNNPAAFKYPFYSLASDFKMFFEIITLKRSL